MHSCRVDGTYAIFVAEAEVYKYILFVLLKIISSIMLLMEGDTIDISSGRSLKSSNFGGGLELLMNDKMKEGSGNMGDSIDIGDLEDLEQDLNNLTDDINHGTSATSDLFRNDRPQSVKFDYNANDNDNDNISIGEATANLDEKQSTWDGYGKFNDIPINPEANVKTTQQPHLSKEELLREKFKILRKLEALEKKGVELSKKYNMESSFMEMQGEYETIMDEKARQNSVKFQGNMMMAVINGFEFLNNRFDPFDIKLDGWGEQINENITDYDEIFGELHDKYKSKATMSPELKLLFQLGGSAMMVHMTNTMFKSALPNMDDIMRQNPDLMRQFQSAAVDSMGQNNPGFSGFMSGLMNPEPSVRGGGGPPPPMATQSTGYTSNTRERPGNNSASYGRSSVVDDGINIREVNRNQSASQEKSRRPEMKGPSDISDILSGLKTKTINIHEHTNENKEVSAPSLPMESSTISISDLKELQTDGNLPKKSRRRNGSNKNTISLDI